MTSVTGNRSAALLALIVATCSFVFANHRSELPKRDPGMLELLNSSAIQIEASFTPILQTGAAPCFEFSPPKPVKVLSLAFLADPSSATVLDIVVGLDGHITDFVLVQGTTEPSRETLARSISLWRYEPALCARSPVEAEGVIIIPAQPSAR